MRDATAVFWPTCKSWQGRRKHFNELLLFCQFARQPQRRDDR